MEFIRIHLLNRNISRTDKFTDRTFQDRILGYKLPLILPSDVHRRLSKRRLNDKDKPYQKPVPEPVESRYLVNVWRTSEGLPHMCRSFELPLSGPTRSTACDFLTWARSVIAELVLSVYTRGPFDGIPRRLHTFPSRNRSYRMHTRFGLPVSSAVLKHFELSVKRALTGLRCPVKLPRLVLKGHIAPYRR